ncbi:MAG TPA: TM2 domain-containing protein [Oxalicibacterium sp.]|jgi:TM2 domain-containing membrane protein YozV|nr:TM2 domain-containing protein [Oxalicibacterium sp.]
MAAKHKNKTVATLLAALLGGFGAHRFYLFGKKDVGAWVYLFLFPLSIFAGFLAALIIGLTPDAKWDARFNPASGQTSHSGWPVILIVVLTFALGSTAIIASIARLLDLYLTGGAYG